MGESCRTSIPLDKRFKVEYNGRMKQETINEVMRELAKRSIAARKEKYGTDMSAIMKQVRAGKKVKKSVSK